MNPNEETLAFYYELGLAITQWAAVEFALSAIVVNCFDTNNIWPAVSGYQSIDNFRAKLQYVDAVVRTRDLTPQESAKWAGLLDRCGAAAKNRNKLAHYWVLTDANENRMGRRKKLLPRKPPKIAQRGDKFPGAICLRDITGFRLEFSALMCALENFGCALRGQEERFSKSLERPKRPPTIAQIRREIYAYASRTPQSSQA